MVRAVRVLIPAAIVAAASLTLVAPAHASSATKTALKFDSTKWVYQQTAYGADSGFQDPSYDVSGWPTGRAGFGTTSGCSFNTPKKVHTPWALDTDMLLRHSVKIPAGATNVVVFGTVDNDAEVYLNGDDLGGVSDGNCQTDGIDVTVPSADLLAGTNLLAIRAEDDGGSDYIDVEVTYTPAAG